MKQVLFAGVVLVALIGAAAVYTLFTPAPEVSAPIEAIPLELESSPAAGAATEQAVAESEANSEIPAASPTTTAAIAAPEEVEEAQASPEAEVAAPPKPTETTAAAGPLLFEIDQASSQARYVIDEVLRGSPTTVIGATNHIAGQIAVSPADLSTTQVGTITINARTFATDQSRRDQAVQNWVLQTSEYEYITFTPTAVTGLPEQGAVGESYTFQVTGDLTIRDQTREVTWDVTVTPVADSRIEGRAQTTIRYGDWGLRIPDVPFVADVSEEVRLEVDWVANPAS